MVVNFLLFASLIIGFGNEEIGTSAFPILRQGFGPRASALGESFVALSDDATASWWNSAGLGIINKNYIFFSHQKWFLDTRDEYFSSVFSSPYGSFSASIIYSAIDEVEAWTEEEEQLTSFNTYTTIVNISYGGKITDKFFIGAGIKGIYDNLNTISATGGCLDIGALYHLKDWSSVGITIQNLGPPIHYVTSEVSLPLSLKTGLKLSYKNNANYLLDVNIPEKGKPELHSGLEYTFHKILSLRLGMRTGPQNSNLGLFTYGAGINWSNLGFDYAFIPYGVLGNTHRIALSYVFPSFFKKTKKSGVTIKVADAYTNSPLKAMIRFQGAFSGKEWTDITNGEFHRKYFPEGKTIFTISKNGYAQKCDSFIHKKSTSTEIKVLLRKPMPSAIIGALFDAKTNEQIIGSVHCYGPVNDTVRTKDSGNYEIGNLAQGKYELNANSPEYISQTKEIFVGSGEIKEVSFYLVKGEGKITLEDIFFDTGKAKLRENAFQVLESIGKVLIDNPTYSLKIEGHTDAREIKTKKYPSNWELSQARANSAKNYLLENYNIDKNRIKTEGFADTKPVAPNDTEENLQKNRRVEFIIIKE